MSARHMVTRQERMRELCVCIARYVEDNGTPPTIREIGDELGMASTNTVTYWLRDAEAAGLLTRKSDRARSLRLTDKGRAIASEAV